MLTASSLKSKALVLINRGHGLQSKTLEGQHRSIVFTNDEDVMFQTPHQARLFVRFEDGALPQHREP